MSFYHDYLKNLDYEKLKKSIYTKTRIDVENALEKRVLNSENFEALLSPAADEYIEAMAGRSQRESLKHFGKAIVLYTPMYLANYCVNKCLYCGFNHSNTIERRKLTMEEIKKEAKKIADTGLRHILILTGECRKEASVDYIANATEALKDYFDSISIEVYPLEEMEYQQVIASGVDGLTLYQEVYHPETYKKVHVAGPKANYKNRIEAVEKACRAGIRSVNIGALLGLGDWRVETYITGVHLHYLSQKYPDIEYGVSIPRIKPHTGKFKDIINVSDRDIVHSLLAYRSFLPYTGLNLSTREEPNFRENLIPLGVTRMSAGVSTSVGGHTAKEKSEKQFKISDERSVAEIKEVILNKGYQPIFKDWMRI